MLDELAVLVERTNRVIAQARTRVDGDQPDGATRLVSLHEPDARPIRKGRLGTPVEFGYKAQVVDTVDGIIVDHSVHIGNPSDTDLIRPAIERIVDQFGATRHGDGRSGLLGRHHRSRPHRRRRHHRRDPPHRESLRGTSRHRTRRHVRRHRQVAHRMRRPHLPPETRLGVATHPTTRPRRCYASGAATACSATTSSNSPNSNDDRPPTTTRHEPPRRHRASTRPAHRPPTGSGPRRRVRTDLFDPHAGHATRTPPTHLLLPGQVVRCMSRPRSAPAGRRRRPSWRPGRRRRWPSAAAPRRWRRR